MAKVISMSLRYDLVMRTNSGVELFYNPEANVYMSEDMDAIMNALVEDMNSNNIIDSIMATSLFEKMKTATLINQ